MDLDPKTLSSEHRYRLLTGCVVPRPIAVVSTISPRGIPNVAPFSYFSVAGHDPLALSFCVAGPKSDGTPKDSLRNAQFKSAGGMGEFVINIAVTSYIQAIAKAGTSLPYEESEFELTNLTPIPSKCVAAPRVGESPVTFECRTLHIIPIGISTLVIGEVVHIVIQEDLITEGFKVDATKLQAIGRMSGAEYCRTQDRFEV